MGDVPSRNRHTSIVNARSVSLRIFYSHALLLICKHCFNISSSKIMLIMVSLYTTLCREFGSSTMILICFAYWSKQMIWNFTFLLLANTRNYAMNIYFETTFYQNCENGGTIKCIHDLAQPNLCNRFRKRSNLHELHTRNRKPFQITLYDTTTNSSVASPTI